MSSAPDESGVVLSEMLVVMLVTALLVAAMLSMHAQLQGQLLHLGARQQAYERARLASLIIEQEVKRAGFWGLPSGGDIHAMPPALSAARGEIRCQRQPCVTSRDDALAGSGRGSDGLIVRYARASHELTGTDLPFIDVTGSRQGWRYYATGLYLSGSPRGLFQRIAGRRSAEELVRGICELRCRYAEINEQGRVGRWQPAAAVQQWHAVVALQCRISATGGECRDQRTMAQRQLSVALRNPLERWKAQQQWQQLAHATPKDSADERQ